MSHPQQFEFALPTTISQCTSKLFISSRSHSSNLTGISGAKPGSSGIDPEVVLENQDNEVYGVIPKVPLPSFNSPTRFCMKTGYLMMQVNQPSEEEYKDDIKKTYLVYEINL